MTPQNTSLEDINFQTFGLSEEVLKAIEEMGFTEPSPIQKQSIPLLLNNNSDFIGLASTGTGKTAAFALPLLEKLDPNSKKTQALILCPTRELAMQVTEQVNLLGKYKKIKAVAVYGGASYRDQIYALDRNPAVVVGTPGRIIDHLDRGTLKLEQVQTLILDEADEMISMGFQEDLELIMGKIDREIARFWLFSATMSREIRQVADGYLVQPDFVQMNKQEMLSDKVEQIFYMVREADKAEVLCKLIEANEGFYGLVFCQTKALVADLSEYLSSKGYRVDSLHGDKDQKARERTLQAFRNKKVTILVCTDVAARGIDIKDITHVINYSLPRELDNYVHRIGRTARSGKTGVAMNLVTPSHLKLVNAIERMTKSKMLRGVIPNRKDISMKRVSSMKTKFIEQPSYMRAMAVLDDSWKETLSGMTTEEVAGRFLAMMVPDLFVEKPKEKNADLGAKKKDHQASESTEHSSERRRPRRDEEGSREHRGSYRGRRSHSDSSDEGFQERRREFGDESSGERRRPRRELDGFESKRPSRGERGDDRGSSARRPRENDHDNYRRPRFSERRERKSFR